MGIRRLLGWGRMPYLKKREQRVVELHRLSEQVHKRVSTSPFDMLCVSLVPGEAGLIRVIRYGHKNSDKTFKTPREAEIYIHRFYNNILDNGSGAPNDLFVDSLQSVTTKKGDK
jgi:hypothetical protein